MPLCISDTWLWHLPEILQSPPDKGQSFGHRFQLKHPEAAVNRNAATVITYSLITQHAKMNSYRFCFAAFPRVTLQTGTAFCTKGSGSSCTNQIRQNDKLSDVAHWKSWVFSIIAFPTQRLKVRLPPRTSSQPQRTIPCNLHQRQQAMTTGSNYYRKEPLTKICSSLLTIRNTITCPRASTRVNTYYLVTYRKLRSVLPHMIH